MTYIHAKHLGQRSVGSNSVQWKQSNGRIRLMFLTARRNASAVYAMAYVSVCIRHKSEFY